MAHNLTIELRLLDEGMDVPGYAHPHDAGADLCSTIDFVLEPFERRLVPTGIALALPQSYAGFIHPRSGLASRHGITVVNAPGTIDAGYRGEIKVPLINLDPREPMTITRGDRIAQLIIQEIARAHFVCVDELDDTARGVGGFGSTGGVDTGLTTQGD